ncbi:MAG: hypothetical protein IJ438_09515 [Clostridia bacterium]|nr:hypothetical protein [Clostridia bacterium]
MRTISVVLTKYTDWFSKLFWFINGGGYTHASLALDYQAETMYSFNFKGFCRETMARHRRRGVRESVSYTLAIPDAAYDSLVWRIRKFERRRRQYRYTKLGVLMCLLRIPFVQRNRYFCSQFVAEALSSSGALRLRKHPALYLPNHFMQELAHCAQLTRIRYNPV